ncbi:MAG: type VI secretion system baseplate subunit TssE [Gemmataceae bacterium]
MGKQRPLLPSLMDRLFDDNPGAGRDVIPARQQDAARLVLRQVKESLHRDLEALLNTRVRNVVWGRSLKELDGSLLDYGLPDFTHVSLASEDERGDFCRRIEAIIRAHEPRLISVRVVSLTEELPVDRTFRFRIHARLKMDPAPEPVQFDSVLRAATWNFRIEGGGA